MGDYAKTFRDLRVYAKATGVERAIFEIPCRLPRNEQFSLVDQVRRSCRSIGAQIAEAWAKRRYPAHFVSILTDTDAEQQETQHWLECAVRSGYLTPADVDPILQELSDIGRMLHGMMSKADNFCGTESRADREETGLYLEDAGPRVTDYGSLP